MLRSSLACILPRLYSLHQSQYPTTAQDVMYLIAQDVIHLIDISQQAKKLREPQLIFVHLSQQSVKKAYL